MKIETIALKIKQALFDNLGNMWCVTEEGELWKIVNGKWTKFLTPEIIIHSE